MTDEFIKAAREMADDQRKKALQHLEGMVDEDAAGVIRQILAGERPLSEKQKYVYQTRIEPAIAEKCGNERCPHFVPAGDTYCSGCEVELGA
jgi:hypothetical protein